MGILGLPAIPNNSTPYGYPFHENTELDYASAADCRIDCTRSDCRTSRNSNVYMRCRYRVVTAADHASLGGSWCRGRKAFCRDWCLDWNIIYAAGHCIFCVVRRSDWLDHRPRQARNGEPCKGNDQQKCRVSHAPGFPDIEDRQQGSVEIPFYAGGYARLHLRLFVLIMKR